MNPRLPRSVLALCLFAPFALLAAPPGDCPAGKAGSDARAITLAWENIPVEHAMKSLLGDALGVDYVVPTVPTQSVTLRVDAPVDAAEAVELLDAELAKQGLGLRCDARKYFVAAAQ